jgi:choline dehydrogenase-like flavoprotein
VRCFRVLVQPTRSEELYPAAVNITGYGEGLPLESNYVEIDREGLTDRYGIPQVRFHSNAEYEHAFAIRDEMCGQMEEILKVSGAELLPYEARAPYPMGSVTHEAGGARMGNDPKKSVLDAWNRCHDIKNLLVVDASCFVSHPEKSVTSTIMALAMRANEHLAEDIRLGSA